MPMDFSAAELRAAFTEQCALEAAHEANAKTEEEETRQARQQNGPQGAALGRGEWPSCKRSPPAQAAGQLGPEGFCVLVQGLLQQRNFQADASDLKAAFHAADADRSGGVDVFEFVRLFDRVQSGQVHGLGTRGTRLSSAPREQARSLGSDASPGDDVSPATRHVAAFQSRHGTAAGGRASTTATKKVTGAPFVGGDVVCWRKSDGELPLGTRGRVLRVHRDGDVEVLFADAIFTFAGSALAPFPLDSGHRLLEKERSSTRPMAPQKCTCSVS
jgi:hypothetical protein